MNTDQQPATSQLHSPPLEESWCHVSETITMLHLAVCQIETAVGESHTSVNDLTHSFTSLAAHTHTVHSQIQNLSQAEEIDLFKEKLGENTNEMQTTINAAITAFQFYDRISQRLDHVAHSLKMMTELLSQQDRIKDPVAWKRVQNDVKSSYSMEAERIMFEHIMRGASVEEALEIYQHHFSLEDTSPENEDDDEIELF